MRDWERTYPPKLEHRARTMASFHRLAGSLRRCVRPVARATLATAAAYTLVEWDQRMGGGGTVALLERSKQVLPQLLCRNPNPNPNPVRAVTAAALLQP